MFEGEGKPFWHVPVNRQREFEKYRDQKRTTSPPHTSYHHTSDLLTAGCSMNLREQLGFPVNGCVKVLVLFSSIF